MPKGIGYPSGSGKTVRKASRMAPKMSQESMTKKLSLKPGQTLTLSTGKVR